MKEELATLYTIFSDTKGAIEEFMAILDPVIKNAKDDHERLYYHHIYEEEEHRLSRLAELIPLLNSFKEDNRALSPSNRDFNRLLQELNLEKFGLHNFVEHLDLALFSFKDEERHSKLSRMREMSYTDYLKVKDILADFNQRFDYDYEDPHEHHDEEHDHLETFGQMTGTISTESKASTGITSAKTSDSKTPKKTFTVGSLIKF